MAITVTATQTGSTSAGVTLRVMVLTQAATSQTGATAAIASAQSGSITTTQTGSRVYGASVAFTTGTYTALGNTTSIDTIADNGEEDLTFKAAALTGTPGPTTLGYTSATGNGGIAMYEVLTAGTLTEDASAPAVASTTAATTVTTAAFTPPAGSLLVAMGVSQSNGSTVQLTVSGGGLQWVQKAAAGTGTNNYSGVWIAQVPATPAGIAVANTPTNVHATAGSVTGSWAGRTTVAGNLLVAVVTVAAATSCTATATTSGWSQAAGHGIEEPNSGTAHARAAIWTKTAAGSDAAPVFTSTLSGTGAMDCMLFELSSAVTGTPIDTSGVYASGASTLTLSGSTITATTAGNVAAAGEYAIAVVAQERAAAVSVWTDTGTGNNFGVWLSGNSVSSVLQTYIGSAISPPSGATLNDSGNFTTNTTAYGAAIVAVFAATPAGAITGGKVLTVPAGCETRIPMVRTPDAEGGEAWPGTNGPTRDLPASTTGRPRP